MFLDELAILLRLGDHCDPFGIGEKSAQRFSRSAMLSQASM